MRSRATARPDLPRRPGRQGGPGAGSRTPGVRRNHRGSEVFARSTPSASDPGRAARVPILELSDWRGVPTMARGREAPLDLRLAVGACVLTPHAARAARGRLVVTVREAPRLPVPERLGAAEGLAADPGGALQGSGLCAPGRARELAPLRAPMGARRGRDARRHGPDQRRVPPRLGTRPRDQPARAGPSRGALGAAVPSVHRGAKDKRNRTGADQDAAWEDLAGVEILTRTATTPDGSRGWLIVPAEAAAALRSREA